MHGFSSITHANIDVDPNTASNRDTNSNVFPYKNPHANAYQDTYSDFDKNSYSYPYGSTGGYAGGDSDGVRRVSGE